MVHEEQKRTKQKAGPGLVIWNSHFKKRASGIPEIPGNSRESKEIQGNRGNPRLWLEDGAQALDIDHAIVFSS